MCFSRLNGDVGQIATLIKTPRMTRGFSLEVVIPPRFERGTYSLEGCRSIQLSYGTKKLENRLQR